MLLGRMVCVEGVIGVIPCIDPRAKGQRRRGIGHVGTPVPLGFGAVSDAAPSRLRIAIVGSGRVGAVLGAAWHRAGHRIVGATARSRLLGFAPTRCCRVSGLPTRQRLLPTLISSSLLFPIRICRVWWRNSWNPAGSGQFVVHPAGRYGLRVLQRATDVGAIPLAIHPALP